MAELPPLHPGEVLREEFLKPLSLTAYSLAAAIDVPRTRIERLAKGKGGITADTALRLGRYFRMSPEFWMNLQNRFELETKRRALGDRLERIEERASAKPRRAPQSPAFKA
jgi:addiction module HigA family antidote